MSSTGRPHEASSARLHSPGSVRGTLRVDLMACVYLAIRRVFHAADSRCRSLLHVQRAHCSRWTHHRTVSGDGCVVRSRGGVVRLLFSTASALVPHSIRGTDLRRSVLHTDGCGVDHPPVANGPRGGITGSRLTPPTHAAVVARAKHEKRSVRAGKTRTLRVRPGGGVAVSRGNPPGNERGDGDGAGLHACEVLQRGVGEVLVG
jgi:hypothetical protein